MNQIYVILRQWVTESSDYIMRDVVCEHGFYENEVDAEAKLVELNKFISYKDEQYLIGTLKNALTK